MKYRTGDFRAYYCLTQKKHIWILGYFGGGSINYQRFKEAAEDFAERCNFDVSTVHIDEILNSRRHKGFKFLTSTSPNQTPIMESEEMENVYQWLID